MSALVAALCGFFTMSCATAAAARLPALPTPHHGLGRVSDESASELEAWLGEQEKLGARSVVIDINSPGGDVIAGFGLIQRIEASTIPVICVVDGSASSMAFAVLQSCTTRIMTRRSWLMAHQASASGEIPSGSADDYRNIADYLDALNEAMAIHDSHRLNVPIEYYKNRVMGGRQWWFTAADALRFAAVDKVIESAALVK